MNTNFLNWKQLNFVEYGNNYSINLETSEIRNDKTGRIIKTSLRKGYYRVNLHMDGKMKTYSIHILLYIAHFGEYDKSKYVIDHIDHDKTNNSISNLRLVTHSINNINIPQHRGLSFDYKSELPNSITINAEQGIYYCKLYDKFYREVSKDQFRELRENKRTNSNGTYIFWSSNNIRHTFTTTHFRETLVD